MNVPYVLGAEDPTQTHHWLWSEGYELLFGSIAPGIVLALLIWKAGPRTRIGYVARSHRVQQELDDANRTLGEAREEAQRIRAKAGDIEEERRRLLAEADTRAAALLDEGRARLAAEVSELEAKADADISALAGRAADELRADIGRIAADSAERVVQLSVDDSSRQQLVEDFIARVGASRPAEVTS